MRRGGGARQEGITFNLGPGSRQRPTPPPTEAAPQWWSPVSRLLFTSAAARIPASLTRMSGLHSPPLTGFPPSKALGAVNLAAHRPSSGSIQLSPAFRSTCMVMPPPRNDPPRSSCCALQVSSFRFRQGGLRKLPQNPQLRRTSSGPTCVMGERGVPESVRSAALPACSRRDEDCGTRPSNGYLRDELVTPCPSISTNFGHRDQPAAASSRLPA